VAKGKYKLKRERQGSATHPPPTSPEQPRAAIAQVSDRLPAPQPFQRPSWRRLHNLGRHVGAIIVMASVLIGLLGLLVFRSDVTINPTVRLNASDPFSTLFVITNEGEFSIVNVKFFCHMNYVEVRNYRFLVTDQPAPIDPTSEPNIEAHNSQDVTCFFGAMGTKIVAPPNGPRPIYNYADITLSVSYRPYFWWSRTKSQRFIARTDGNGNIVQWSHQS
jgi:hypothetical protein